MDHDIEIYEAKKDAFVCKSKVVRIIDSKYDQENKAKSDLYSMHITKKFKLRCMQLINYDKDEVLVVSENKEFVTLKPIINRQSMEL